MKLCPKLKHDIRVENPNTKVTSTVTLEGLIKVFLINFSHNNLENYFKTNFAMMQHHKYSLSDIENMIP